MSLPKHEISTELFQPAQVRKENKEVIARPSISFWKDAWIRLRKNKAAVTGLIIIVFIALMAFIGPQMSKYGFNDQDLMRVNLPPKVQGLENISFLGLDGVDIRGMDQYKLKQQKDYFWFGTDALGRDQWTRIWEGTQVSLLIAFVAAILDLLIGITYGGISAFYGGKTDNYMQRFIEILIGIPNLVIIILLILILKPGITSIIIAMAISGWTGMARIVRAQILKLKGQEFVLASRTLGAGDKRLVSKHLIPNVLGPIIITTTFTIPTAIFFEAFLSFIGLGLRPPTASLGSLVNEGFRSLQIFPHLMLIPSIIISLLMISFNMLGDGLRDALDPKMRK
ncbi:oligopeptide ABC transporter permease [Fictibacillus aquaticus]|uniref:Peptide ABC transporter permease n=1 Tax=Fictibacillus aquaticus TaxID=2021314 RepID=A0A235FDQ3_9BACL|nr:oligopeptide ABC transporter permease [Fictibacillus aquaticus]OYD59073.1 peptide ABC transporter permease [Fictibacillus aquaticus]